MFKLVTTGEYVLIFAIAAVCGIIGGLVYELLQTRRAGTGRIERPFSLKGSNFWDAGVLASLLVGGVAALAALYVFPPRIEIADASGQVVSSQYEIVKLVALSLIVGSAGPSVLAGLQGRVLSVVNAQQAKNAQNIAKAGLAPMATSAADEAERAVNEALAAQPGLDDAGRSSIAAKVASEVRKSIEGQAKLLERTIEAGSRPVDAPG